MTDLKNKLADLETRLQAAQREEARARALQEAAEERRQEALKTLKADFGVSTEEEAAKLIEKLERSLAEDIAIAQKKLEEST